ncbi:MAG: ABC transporter permease [Candidatus Pacearchaeota archaeon]
MRLKKALNLSFNMLIHSKLRSYLTIIGIVIGIGAVVAILAVSQGAQKQLEEQLSSLGADILTISPGFSRAMGVGGGFRTMGGGPPGNEGITTTSSEQKNLTAKDVLVIKSISNVKSAMGTVSGREEVSYLGKSATISIQGIDTEVWKDFINTELDSGRYLTKGDSNSIVVGSRVANSIFEDGMQTNRQVTIGGKTFKIVGILKSGGTDDSTIFMPIEMAREVLEDVGKDEFDSISVKIANVEITEDTIEEIEKKLMSSRGILQDKDMDFSVSNPAAMQETITSSISSISLFLAAIAAISLVVGAVGIANTMFTSVLEKTKEIGIMKAIGAQNKDILLIFLFNSGLLGLVGGIGGIILGILGAGYVGGMVGDSLGRFSLSSTYFSPTLILGAFLISIGVGMIAGAIPAYRASKLKPVDALRYE